MGAVLLVLLVIWAAVAVLGVVVKGLLWLALAGLVLFVLTGVVGLVRGRSRG